MADEEIPPPENTDEAGDASRDASGRFLPGKSGNAGGRPRSVKDTQDQASQHTGEAIETLVEIMRWGMQNKTASRVREARQAAVAILDRACGRPAQPISGVPGQPVGIDVAGNVVTDFLKKIAGEE